MPAAPSFADHATCTLVAGGMLGSSSARWRATAPSSAGSKPSCVTSLSSACTIDAPVGPRISSPLPPTFSAIELPVACTTAIQPCTGS